MSLIQSTTPTYYLNILGGNPEIHNTRLVADTDGTLIIPGLNATTITVPPSTPYTSPYLTFGPEPHSLVAPPLPSLPARSQHSQYYVLKGPAGKGIYKLVLSDQVSPPRGLVGSSTRWDSWEVVSEAGLLWLRDFGLMGQGFWVAVPGTDQRGKAAWEIWWLTPGGATVNDLEGYVMVNIEVAKDEEE